MTPPPCRAVGAHCLALPVTIRVAEAETPDIRSADHEATWLLGHTERIEFGPLKRHGRELLAGAVLFVPCRFAVRGGDDAVRCGAHGFAGRVTSRRPKPQPRQLGLDRFAVVEGGRVRSLSLLPENPAPTRALRVVQSPNPCASARCRTADNRVGAACCRDLQVEILCPPEDRHLEALVRARQSPYLCKVSRDKPDSLGVEMISACGFLEQGGGVSCTLHGRTRPDGRTAKPDLCFTWPEPDDMYHPKCAFDPTATP